MFAEWRMARSASTITSESRRITTRSRIASIRPRSRCASPPAPSRSSARVSASPRISARRRHEHTTLPEHMASSHRRYAGWTIERIRKDAAASGRPPRPRRRDPARPTASRTGLPRLPRHHPARPILRAERLDAAATRAIEIGARTYGSVKSILANNLDRRPSPARGRRADPPSQHPRAALLQLRRSRLAHASDPRSTPRARPSRYGQGLRRHRSAARPQPRPRRMACAAARTRSVPTRQAAPTRLQYAKLRQQACIEDIDYRTPRGLDRTLLTMLVEGQLDRRPRQPADLRALRRRQELARLGARQQGLPRQSLRALSARPAAVHRSRFGARRWPPSPAAARARPCRSPHPRRLGPRAARPRPATTSWRSSRIATAAAPPSSPASSRSINGTR